MRIFSSIRSSLFAFVVLAMSASAFAQIGISISVAPPELLTYEQPVCPGDGYLWTPGYWAYADADTGYYWVPGHGSWLPNQVFSGRLGIGAGAATAMPSMKATGD